MAMVCGTSSANELPDSSPGRPAGSGRLSVRAHKPTTPSAAEPHGSHPIGLDSGRDGVLYVPDSYKPETPAPLVMMLHGAGGAGARAIRRLLPLADAAGLILLAPDSRDSSWDAIRGGFGPDVTFIDRALGLMFDRYAIDPARVTIEGFSDGASYALSLGLGNGDLFSRIIAFSPGFVVPAAHIGKPLIFESHGTADEILPIDRCSRVIVPELKHAGYNVHYREFNGPHAVPPEIAKEAIAWLQGDGTAGS